MSCSGGGHCGCHECSSGADRPTESLVEQSDWAAYSWGFRTAMAKTAQDPFWFLATVFDMNLKYGAQDSHVPNAERA